VASVLGLVLAGCVPGVTHEETGVDGVSGASASAPRGPSPTFDVPRNAERPARPLVGGTLLPRGDGRTAVAADPDRDRVFVADYVDQAVVAEVALEPGDEPGRLVEDGEGRVHVALRGGGAVVTLMADPWRVAARRTVCAAPRGIAYDRQTALVHVACADGVLVSLPAAPDGVPVRRLELDSDLRDVVVDGDVLLVSRFRSAEVLTVDRDGNVMGSATPAPRSVLRVVKRMAKGKTTFNSEPGTMRAGVASRLVSLRPGQALLLHQRAMADEVPVDQPGGYSGNCGGIVEDTISAVGALAPPRGPSPALANLAVATDLAISPDGLRMAVAAAGNRLLPFSATQLTVLPTSVVFSEAGSCGGSFGARPGTTAPGAPPATPDGGAGGELPEPVDARPPSGQVTSVAFDKRGHLLVQTREPASIQVLTANRQVILSRDSRADVGLDIFYSASGAGIACASCHPEGGEDGRVWRFADAKGTVEARRTQSLRGGILGTAPFHWNGDLKTLGTLMTEVFVRRMNGPPLADDYVDVLGKWIDSVPALPRTPARDPAAAERGRGIFQSPAAGCASCHNGPLLTNNATVDVGTGRPMQVPSLRGVGWRAPFMHDGCAGTLAARFMTTACGGGDRHGVTSKLTAAQLADLTAYLQTL
jgi:hypothetical protein